MKNRASLVLMEQLVIILVFALCAALCLQAFVAADAISHETGLRDEAAVLAQNTAECLKAGIPLPQAPEGLQLQITYLDTDLPGLDKARICVYSEDTGKELITFTAGWQEVGK